MTQTATTEVPKRKKRSKKEPLPEKENTKNGKQNKIEAKEAPPKNGKRKKEAPPLPTALLPEEQEPKGKSKKLINVDALILESCKSVGISCEYPVQFSSPVNCIHSGSFLFDLVSSGGFRNGRMHTISGPSGAGKSTLMQYVVLAAQKQGLRIYHFDIEKSAIFTYMKRQGIKMGDDYRLANGDRGYYYFRPRTLEEAYKAACRLLEILPTPQNPNTRPDTILILDSYKSMVPQEHLDGKATLGLHARLHDYWQPILRNQIENSTATLVATNQMRVKGIGSFFCREEESAGNALKFYADARYLITRSKTGSDQKGWGKCPDHVSPVSLRVIKNRMCDSEGIKADMRFIRGLGFDLLHDRLAFLVMIGEVKKLEKNMLELDGEKCAYKKARTLMREKEWYKLCQKKRKDIKVYENFFNQRAPAEEWEL